MLLSDIIAHDHTPRTIAHTMTIKEVITDMIQHNHNSFLVVNESKSPLGYITVQDIAAAIIPPEFVSNPAIAKAMYEESFLHDLAGQMAGQPISSIMRTDLVIVDYDENLMAVFALFVKHDSHFLCVQRDDAIIAVMTRRDLKRILADAMDIERNA